MPTQNQGLLMKMAKTNRQEPTDDHKSKVDAKQKVAKQTESEDWHEAAEAQALKQMESMNHSLSEFVEAWN